jgi:uncharacterized protein YegP (UPF0339 family)
MEMDKTTQETGQTVQETPEMVQVIEDARGAFIEIAEDKNHQWHWALWAGNGRIVARSGQTHATFKSSVQSLRSIIKLWQKSLPIVRSHKSE